MTRFEITTECVEAVRAALHGKYGDAAHVLSFHATGTGGQCMERLISGGFVDGVIDVTTTECADFVVGGVMPCDAQRFSVAQARRIPTVVSLGAANVVNFGAESSIPARFADSDAGRVWCRHNEQVTPMKAESGRVRTGHSVAVSAHARTIGAGLPRRIVVDARCRRHAHG